jgi:hypothetical protein
MKTQSGLVAGAMALALSGALDTERSRYRFNLTPSLDRLDLGFIDYSRPISNPTGKPKNEKRSAKNKAAKKSRKLNRKR